MPNSLRVKIRSLKYKGRITPEECAEIMEKISGHDRELVGSSDLVPVIRCRDCAYYREYHFGGYCLGVPSEPSVHRSPWDFCSQAVRKKESNYEN